MVVEIYREGDGVEEDVESSRRKRQSRKEAAVERLGLGVIMFRFGLRLIRFWLMVSGLVYLIF